MTHSTSRRNPYVIGRPIDESQLLFGRESLFNFIEENLKQDVKVILLHGQRRIGKSSVLRNIPNFSPPEDFIFVFFDLEYHSRKPLSSILDAIATEIIEQLEFDLDKISIPDITDLETDPYIFSNQFLPQVYQELKDKKLVLLLDEFDALNNDTPDAAVEHFFPYLRSIIELPDNQLFIILCVGRQSADMPNLLNIFNHAPYQEIGLLDVEDASRLITQPAQDFLNYEQNAIDEIYNLTAGHPYFIQVICFNIFVQARAEEKWQVTREDVEAIVDKAIESAEAGLAWFWDGISIIEQVVFSAVAEAQELAILQNQAIPEEPFTLLNNYGIVQTKELVQAAKLLVEKGFLDEKGHRVKIEIVRLWLLQRHRLDTEIKTLGKKQVNLISEKANTVHEDSIDNYERILGEDSNQFSTILNLAKEYLEAENFESALELYIRAYQFDPIRNQDKLLHVLERYGDNLRKQKEFASAKQQYESILEIDPNEISVQQKLQLLTDEIAKEATDNYPKPNWRRRTGIVLGIVVSVSVAFGIYQLLHRCPNNQQLGFGLGCEAKQNKINYPHRITNITRGDRRVFPKILNIDLTKLELNIDPKIKISVLSQTRQLGETQETPTIQMYLRMMNYELV
ncbi:AAA family ATPase [Calothrix sp. FACHB-1219]|uniref:AAA family ATPase n=1 Tax=unclassified Calothrix TaxID=2619626 RepID=UPI001683B519|nr:MULTISPECIES: AAA-like domain-containing protein [unclassified Calothrix]MBD2203088.1 AAA family ATPase [Calothrix sp. FACHB-168]MBD2218689.1 AAA family ATPase [Calothrix sp. FACHB-1219]